MTAHIKALFVERGQSIPIEYNHYRHYTTGITPLVTGGSPRLQHNYLITEAMAIGHLQAGHYTAVAEINYVRRPTDLLSIISSTLPRCKLFSFEWHVCLGLAENNSVVSAQAFSSSLIQQNPLQIPTSLSNSINSTISKSIKQEFKVIQTKMTPLKRPLESSRDKPSPKRPYHYSILLTHPFAVEERFQAYLSALWIFRDDKTAMFRSES